MIGRTAPSNPWIFRQIQQYCMSMKNADGENAHVGTAALGCPSGRRPEPSPEWMPKSKAVELRSTGQPRAAVPTWAAAETLAVGKLYDDPSEADRYQMIRTYFQMLIEEELPDAVGKMKQFASWFTHGVPGGAGLRKAIYESKSAVEILGRVEEFFEAKLCGAGALAREVV
jgi:tRNA-dihydrouridine synthase